MRSRRGCLKRLTLAAMRMHRSITSSANAFALLVLSSTLSASASGELSMHKGYGDFDLCNGLRALPSQTADVAGEAKPLRVAGEDGKRHQACWTHVREQLGMAARTLGGLRHLRDEIFLQGSADDKEPFALPALKLEKTQCHTLILGPAFRT